MVWLTSLMGKVVLMMLKVSIEGLAMTKPITELRDMIHTVTLARGVKSVVVHTTQHVIAQTNLKLILSCKHALCVASLATLQETVPLLKDIGRPLNLHLLLRLQMLLAKTTSDSVL